MNTAMVPVEVDQQAGQEATGSVSGSGGLSILQRNFAREFVANGGQATEAALAAGYAPASARISATKCLCNPRVGAEIERLCRTFIHSGLPAAIHRLISIITNPETKDRDALKAVNSLLERAGMAAPKGGVNIAVGVQVNGQQAQALIGEVWQAKQARLSDIPPAMSDKVEADLRTIEAAVSPSNSDHGGGDELQGPGAGTCPLPAPSSEHHRDLGVSGSGPVDAFKQAFEDGEDDA